MIDERLFRQICATCEYLRIHCPKDYEENWKVSCDKDHAVGDVWQDKDCEDWKDFHAIKISDNMAESLKEYEK